MLSALTIDFWNTLMTMSNGPARRAYRNRAVAEVLAELGVACTEDALAEGYRHIYDVFERHWFGEQRTLTTSDCARLMWDHFGVQPADEAHGRVVKAFEDSILAAPPDPVPGVLEAIPRLAQRYRLAIISDTAFSPGSALRQVMDNHGLLQHFSTLVFSDEIGAAKPHPRAFRAALDALGVDAGSAAHIGDIERTDIAGAKQAGMHAILFTGDAGGHAYNDGEIGTSADATAGSWSDVEAILERWSGASQGTNAQGTNAQGTGAQSGLNA